MSKTNLRDLTPDERARLFGRIRAQLQWYWTLSNAMRQSHLRDEWTWRFVLTLLRVGHGLECLANCEHPWPGDDTRGTDESVPIESGMI